MIDNARHYYDPDHPGCAQWGREYDLCGNKSAETRYTWKVEEVTCERCLAALRTLSGAASPGCQGAPQETNPKIGTVCLPTNPTDLDRDAVALLKSYSRLAVLAERERIAKFVEGLAIAVPNQWELAIVQVIRDQMAKLIRESENG